MDPNKISFKTKTLTLIKKKRFVLPFFVLVLLFTLNTFKTAHVLYLPFKLPGTLMGSTIPPFGIIIHNIHKNKIDDVHCTVLEHEMWHWTQYKRMGLFSFYYNYLKEYIKSGRKNHWMEKEARDSCFKNRLNK
jgi:hypothetical protein